MHTQKGKLKVTQQIERWYSVTLWCTRNYTSSRTSYMQAQHLAEWLHRGRHLLPIHDCPSTTRIKFSSSDSQRTQLREMMRTPRPSYNPVKCPSLTNLDSPLPFSQRLTAEMASKQLHMTFLHKFLSSFTFHHMFLRTRAAPKCFAWRTKCSQWQLWSRHSLRMNTKRCNNGKKTLLILITSSLHSKDSTFSNCLS